MFFGIIAAAFQYVRQNFQHRKDKAQINRNWARAVPAA